MAHVGDDSIVRPITASKAMPDTWVTDLTDYLEDGRLHPELAGIARRLAAYFCSIVFAITSTEPDDPLGVRCRRRPSRRPCPGPIEGFVAPESDHIRWMCLSCGDNGFILNWRNTMWDCSGARIHAPH